LNIFSAINLLSISTSWAIISIIFATIYYKKIYSNNTAIKFTSFAFSTYEKFSLLGIGLTIMVIALIALIAPPNNGDSMVYHIARVFHWAQNNNINSYPTHVFKQLNHNPGAEFIILHLQILTGTDRFSNFAQWFAMIGSVVGVSLISKELGANMRWQVFSSVICVTIPTGILQASSTQNDYLASFWIICFVYFVLQMLKRKFNYNFAFMTGLSLGLAFLVKGTGYIFTFPFLLWLSIVGFARLRINFFKFFLIIMIVALSINFGYYYRNIDLQNTPFVKLVHTTYDMNFLLLLSNAIRNIGLHFGTPSVLLNKWIFKIIELFHIVTGVNLNDHRTTIYGNYGAYHIANFNFFHEDYSANFIHILIILSSILIFFKAGMQKSNKKLLYYLLFTISGFFLFSWIIMWNPWNHRYHLPIFILFSPFISVTLQKNSVINKKLLLIALAITVAFFICSVVFYQISKHFPSKEETVDIFKRYNLMTSSITNSPKELFQELLLTVVLLLGIFIVFYFINDIAIAISIIAFIFSLPWVFYNETRNIIGKRNIFNTPRVDQYFLSKIQLKEHYKRAAKYIVSKGYSEIGLICSGQPYGNNWEYPFLMALKHFNRNQFRLEHVNVENLSSSKYKKYPFNNFTPSAIVYLCENYSEQLQPKEIKFKDIIFLRKFYSPYISIFVIK
jgi:4-amino-4-deoxy-L-arabinose transferase-like glycosyltransferase